MGSTSAGGGIFAGGYANTLNIQSSHITGNDSLTVGGGILSYCRTLTLRSSEISGNYSHSTRYGSNLGGGGGLWANVFLGSATIDQSTFDNNKSTGYSALGAGAYISSFASPVTITETIISGNQAIGTEDANTGGLHIAAYNGSNVLIDRSTITGNHADDDTGGLYIKNNDSVVTLTNSTISGNTAYGNSMSGYDAAGGAWIATSYGGSTTIENSTISGNSTVAPVGTYTTNLPGGGLFIQNRSGTTTILNSTISGNQAEESGGGIKIYEGGGGELRILHSTITNNRANSNGDGVGVGGGIDVGNSQTVVTLDHTIVAGNYHGGEMASTRDDINVGQFFGGSLTVTWSLIGDNAGSGLAGAPVGSPDVNGNLIGTSAVPIDPKLAPLAFNGGPTRTHALLPGSPAIDAGDPNFDPNSFTPPLLYDQRGESFARA